MHTIPAVICPYCSRPAELVDGTYVYPTRMDLTQRKFWLCYQCHAWVGCHAPGARVRTKRGVLISDGTIPLGLLANDELRRARSKLHETFDPLWKGKMIRRTDAYRWLALKLNIDLDDCHIGMFTLAQCNAAMQHIKEYKK